MPTERSGEIALPCGWEEGRDHDGKLFYIDHTTQKTTWIDPRDRITKPPSFADCVGDELPVGWEESWDTNVGPYYIDHVNRCNQLEDPRQQYRLHQENMLKEYLVTANEDLVAKKEIYSIKQQRLVLAQDECSHLKDTLAGSAISLNSLSSCSSKHDPDLLRADVALAKNRVSRLKREIEQVKTEMKYKERGLETLTQVSEKMLGQQSIYSVNEARAILDEIFKIKQSLSSGEKEKKDLLQSLTKLKDDFLVSKFKSESSIDVSTLSMDKSNAESQTDLSGELVPIGQRLAEMAKMRLEYDEARKQVTTLQQRLTGIEEQIIPGQADSDKDRLLLIQEKEQLVRELRGIGKKGRTKQEMEAIGGQIHQLELDLSQAVETSNRQIANRLKLQDDKCNLVHSLAEATRRTSLLESQLRSLSLSTLSMSSGSSRGSLGSLSASSSKGSLNSLSFTDIYSQSQYGASDTNLQDLHHRVEKLLQGHSVSPIHEVQTGVSGSFDNIHGSGHYAYDPRIHGEGIMKTLSTGSSFSSLSPPISPYDVGPPPSYEQHMNLTNKRQIMKSSSGSSIDQNVQAQLSDLNLNQGDLASSFNSGSNGNVSDTGRANYILAQMTPIPPLPPSLTSDYADSAASSSAPNSRPRSIYTDPSDMFANSPLSPISETSVCNGISNVTSRSVSAAVSDESVAGDSGVFEASVKRTSAGEEVYECSQIQLKLKYDAAEGNLHISIEQGRKMSGLGVSENARIFVEGLLLPDASLSFKTQESKETFSPKFSEVFKLSIAEHKLFNKTLQVNVMAATEKNEERVGWFQVSLAEFADFDPKPRWYNVLPTKYLEQKSSSCSSRGSISTSSTTHSSPMNGDHVTSVLEASSARLMKTTSPEGRPATHPEAKNIETRSPSLETSLSKNAKEESSDESTIISSQTSTLTRNQGPEVMEFHKEGTPLSARGFSEGMSSSLDDEESELLNFEVPPLIIHEDRSEDDYEDDDDELVTCDKETNTEGNFGKTQTKRRSHGNRNSSVRRSQTFSPADRSPGSSDYICKLNRSDSDSSMPLYRKPFQRNSLERRSLRWKKRNIPKPKTESQSLRTSLDLELDLHASHSKLALQQDEIARLRDLKKRMEDAKAKGETELPSWFSDNERLQQLLNDADKVAKKKSSDVTRHDRRAEHLLNKTLKEAHRQREQLNGEPDTIRFREKMAFFTNVSLNVPAIPPESEDEDEDVDTPRNSQIIE